MDADKFLRGSGIGSLVGNNLRVAIPTIAAQSLPNLKTEVEDPNSRYKSLLKRYQDLAAPRNEPTAANIDIAGIQQRALKQATRSQSPAFKTDRNLIVQDITRRRREAAEGAKRQAEEAKVLLQEFLEDSQISRERTLEDVQGNLEEVNIAEELFQEEEAEKAEQERTQLGEEVAAAGLTTSGLGRQQLAQQKKVRGREGEQRKRTVDAAREEQIRFKTRSFEDLSRGEVRQKAVTKRERQAIRARKESQLKDLAFERVTKLRQLERERKRAVASAQRDFASKEFAQLLGTLGSGQAEATSRAYGGFF